ncbi:MAG: type III PLP-dependent enzyme [Paracoccaceae bacterium]|nr:type III PLP-dependent enzyme [Paracoccaceae bacterium]
MSRLPAVWTTPADHIRAAVPDRPCLYFSPEALQATARRFRTGFPGLVTYAVKANDALPVIENLVQAGITAFDVASVHEMRRVRSVLPEAVLHYNNPVRSAREIETARVMGVASASVDSFSELAKLAAVFAPGTLEVSVRLKLAVPGAAYDFGAKFGADPETCAALLREVAQRGFTPAMTFHPGTQCEDGAAWVRYIAEAAAIARAAGVRLARLNVGGGFAAHRRGAAPDLEAVFDAIAGAVAAHFGKSPPDLVCEPGRALVADAFALGAGVKAIRDGREVFLNDGIYGGLAETVILGTVDRLDVYSAEGTARTGDVRPRVVFGPTCDSLDRLPGEVPLPGDMAEGDVVLFQGMGAYSSATLTRFNGYGDVDLVTVARTR